MPVQSKKEQPPLRPVPSLKHAWEWMAEEDRLAIEEIVQKYTDLAKRTHSVEMSLIDRFYKE